MKQGALTTEVCSEAVLVLVLLLKPGDQNTAWEKLPGVKGNKICWLVIKQYKTKQKKHMNIASSVQYVFIAQFTTEGISEHFTSEKKVQIISPIQIWIKIQNSFYSNHITTYSHCILIFQNFNNFMKLFIRGADWQFKLISNTVISFSQNWNFQKLSNFYLFLMCCTFELHLILKTANTTVVPLIVFCEHFIVY